MKLKLRTREIDGAVRATWLLDDAGRLALLDEAPGAASDPVPLPIGFIVTVLERYGKELAVAAPERTAAESVALALPSGKAWLRCFRFLGYGDVLPTDYLLLEGDGRTTLVAPAPLVADALLALARAAARAQATDDPATGKRS